MRLGSLSAWTRRIVDEGGGGGPTSSIEFSVPSSDLYNDDLFHTRRALTGGTLSRSWLSFTHDEDSTDYAFSFRHNNSGADPTTWVSSLSGATHVQINLGSSSLSSEQVASAFITSSAGVGISASLNGTGTNGNTVVLVQNASSLVLPDSVDTTDVTLRGMWGAQRDVWGGGITENQNGGTGGTGAIYVNNPGAALGRDGRIIGAYLWGQGGFAPRLAVGSGSGYTTSPQTFTMLAEGEVSSSIDDFGIVIFPEPAQFSSTDTLWAFYRENNAGGPRYRSHGDTVAGTGTLGLSEELLWDTTTSAAASNTFGSSYSMNVDNTFTIYIMIGIIFELEDENGNYPADGSVGTWVGYQNSDINAGTQLLVSGTDLTGETTHHRFYVPQWTNYSIDAARRGTQALEPDEDSSVVFYQWADLDIPSTGTHNLLQQGEPMDMVSGSGFNTHILSSSIPIGTETLGSDAIVSIGFNYVSSSGADVVTYTLPVFQDLGGSGAYVNCWYDDRETWHDDIVAASGYIEDGTTSRVAPAGGNEYRTVASSTMPTSTPTEPWPDPFDTDPTDDRPLVIALDAMRFTKSGFSGTV